MQYVINNFNSFCKKAGVVTLQKLLIREKASDSRGIYIISSNPGKMKEKFKKKNFFKKIFFSP
jgi:PH domain